MRNTILACGGEVHFQTKMTSLILNGDKVLGVVAESTHKNNEPIEQTFHGPVILATGHSARDVYRYFAEAQIEMETKGIAVGVRLEHPSELIDQIQYHSKNGRGSICRCRILVCDTSTGTWCLFVLHVSRWIRHSCGNRA